MFKTSMSWMAGVLSVIGLGIYTLATFRGYIQPNAASWGIWALLDSVILAGMVVKRCANGQIWTAAILSWVVAFCAVFYGTQSLTTTDFICLIGTIVGILAWKHTKNPLWAIMICCGLVLLGTVPTWASILKDPTREKIIIWTPGFFSPICASLSVRKATLESLAQPITFLFTSGSIIFLLIILR